MEMSGFRGEIDAFGRSSRNNCESWAPVVEDADNAARIGSGSSRHSTGNERKSVNFSFDAVLGGQSSG